ncbi:hypothetical protein CesoFtcFv8_017063 [Champsocephalus esox]|uniref:Endonuclease/exonuclease/phosphatase domain-containing protein n=1 Tax=Champsocephalus esox TaxID=159716 RepID=A0AAN8GNQ6_9TELE|nr:hypothetical protein CesoFtcFv8_017063 [Champsocephalus esox]
MLKYSISQLLSFTNSSTPSSISVIRHLGLLRRPRYIHRSTRHSFVYFQHGQSIASICSTQRTVAHLTRHQNATPTAPFSPAHLHSQLHVIPGADPTPLRFPTYITSHFSPPSSPPPLLHCPPSRAHPRAANLANLIPLQSATTPPTPHLTNFALLNIRSLNNKAHILHEIILDKSIDFFLLTETWQQPNDLFSLNQTSPPGFNDITKPRPSVPSFEFLAFKAPPSLTVILIYRPPKPHPSFLSDLTELLTIASSLSSRLLLLGDLNIHMDSPPANSLLNSPPFWTISQLPNMSPSPPMIKNTSLTLSAPPTSQYSTSTPAPFPSLTTNSYSSPSPPPSATPPPPRTITFRNVRSVDPQHLSDLLSSTLAPGLEPQLTPDEQLNHLNSTLLASLNSLATLKRKNVTFKTSSPWFTPALRKLKQTGRQLERLTMKSSLTVHHESYKLHLTTYRDAFTAAKTAYLSTIFTDPSHNPRTLFSTVNKLLKPRADTLPSSTSTLCS